MPRNNIHYNIEDTGKLMTQSAAAVKKKTIIIAAIAMAAVVLIGFFGIRALGEKRYDDQIAIAEKAMQEGDYAQAETAYLKAVGMSKRKPKAREGLAYAYAIQSKFEDAQKEYQSLYEDTGEEKYHQAAEIVSEGRMPIDSSLIVATAWREISLDEAPYPHALEWIVLTTAWWPGSGYTYDAKDVPDREVLLEIMWIAGGYSGGLVTPANEVEKLTEEEYYRCPWDVYAEDDFLDEALPWESDPRGWFEDAYIACEQDMLEKYLRDIFNLSDESIEAMRTAGEESESFYLQDGYYYMPYPFGGDISYQEINTIWTNGKQYCVKYDSVVPDADDYSDYITVFYEMLELKYIDGKPYWTMSYNGPEMPEEVILNSDTQSADSAGEELKAYADVLKENEYSIKDYWWQEDEYGDMYNEYNDSYDGAAGDLVNPCVALYDLNGDGTDELLFFSSEMEYEAILHIYTYSDGRAVECDYLRTGYDNEKGEFLDAAVAGGTRYIIYSGKNTGTFYLAHVISDEWSVYTVSKMNMNSAAEITETKQVRLGRGPNSDYSAELTEYSVDGKDVGESQGAKEMADICSDRGQAIMWSDPGALSDIVQIDTDSPIALTYDEAIALFSK